MSLDFTVACSFVRSGYMLFFLIMKGVSVRALDSLSIRRCAFGFMPFCLPGYITTNWVLEICSYSKSLSDALGLNNPTVLFTVAVIAYLEGSVPTCVHRRGLRNRGAWGLL
ncbi:hypothetical protein EV421DRAFT_1805844 [Armillaria borealis]|uniref:Uncharacterized protein n=1 Tax=Armillaria borealis TaxID=47425 RepID=A0AA39MQV1_9AGAR|nr:hypothetical protein EV421DRAFT_1805844 [Armillaria borealis]